MVGLGHQDGVPMVSALMCTVINWTGPMMSHDIRLLGSHDFTKLLHYCFWILREYWAYAEVGSDFDIQVRLKVIKYSL